VLSPDHFRASFNEPVSTRLMDNVGLTRPNIGAQATASDFASWVYDVETGGRNVRSAGSVTFERQHSLAEGKFAHHSIEQLRLWYNRDHPDAFKPNEWALLFADEHNDEEPQRVFKASSLTVGGVAVRCVPDVVLENTRTNEILIIERKTTRAQTDAIPANGWPRLEAQLWCYAWIDDWLSAPEVYLLGQIWSRWGRDPSYPSRTWRKPRWKRSDIEFHANWCEAFRYFGGVIGGAAAAALGQGTSAG
jgi:hypothetical protein